FWQKYSNSNIENFFATGTHKVILSGSGLQEVIFDRPESKFNILTITKPLNTGYIFNRTPLWNVLIEVPEDDKAPSPPKELSILFKTASTIALSWETASDNVGVTGYEIYRNDLKVWSSAGTSYTDTGLEPNRTYFYKVKAFDIAGNHSDFSKEISVVTDLDTEAPSIPMKLTVTSRTSSSISLSWSGSSDNVRLAGYEVYRNDISIAKTNGASFVDSGLEEGTYTYIVKAFDSSNNYSDPSNSVVYDNQAPNAPELTVSSKTTSSVLLSWEAATDNIAVTGYEIYRNGSKINTTKLTSFNDTSLTPDTTYTYFIKAYDAAGNISIESNSLEVDTVIDTQAPSVPINLVIASRTGKSITVRWSASTDNVSVKGYEVYRDGVNIGNSTGTQYIDNDVTVDNVYKYSVIAYDSAGNKSENSAQISGSPVLPHISRVIPSDKTTIGGNNYSLFIYFTNDNNFEGAYAKFEYSIDGEEWTTINTKVYGPSRNSSEASFYINWDLKEIESGIYYLRYTVYDATDNSDSIIVLYQVDRTAPSAPGNLEVSEGSGQVNILWDASPEADVTGYRVYRALEDEGTYSKIADVSGRNSVSYTDINVKACQIYYYKVTAIDKFDQEGLASNIVRTLAGIDDVNPNILGIEPLDGTVFGKSASILVRAEDNLQLKAIKLQSSSDGGKTWIDISSANTSNNATFHWDIPLMSGEVKVRALAVDSAGNT
ncbi:MAG: hypothetical protein GX660_01445, partial [Clostridiaceae bacterium]|nr:hypothetical protein [Clostridiaceae bacterium]